MPSFQFSPQLLLVATESVAAFLFVQHTLSDTFETYSDVLLRLLV